ncbi:DUF3427 domain-containing protein [Rossellomorea vietnamensis]|uniref:DUF3427 domain-containing protein n=1 Tax=Rossellomorea vietnamensis TaxID=218284 RepID=UPI001E5577F8|nr:DUF3427 domain-containing protein [Rossellomorea vietnamensis]MCC5803802.1 DUF3427 domain-containing protein [Rossellomorea vietnamensis]
MATAFTIGNSYSRKDIYNIKKVPEEKQGGNWNTGYTTFNNDVYIFVNLNSAGRTGHNYDNKFIGDDLQWFSKKTHTLNTPTIQAMLNPRGKILIFSREDSKNVFFTYNGVGSVKEYNDSTRVRILWGFYDENENPPARLPEEITKPDKYVEGITKQITVNLYERNPVARKKCIDYYGLNCSICNFNFEDHYGKIGKDFIHVHHLVELSSIGKEYEVDPIKDLIPLCPNCHAMLHKRRPTYSIDELKKIIQLNK